jgi:hypothetical protein
MGYIVEEEIPLQEEHSGQNSASTMEEDLATNSSTANDFVVATMDEELRTHYVDDEDDEQAHPAPSSCKITKYHLVLIFEMRKDLVEHKHCEWGHNVTFSF